MFTTGIEEVAFPRREEFDTERNQVVRQRHSELFQERFEDVIAAIENGAMNGLTPTERLVFEECVLSNETENGMARRLGIAQSTVSKHLAKAGRKIRWFMFKQQYGRKDEPCGIQETDSL
jgi:FixJ family two-component response regulator